MYFNLHAQVHNYLNTDKNEDVLATFLVDYSSAQIRRPTTIMLTNTVKHLLKLLLIIILYHYGITALLILVILIYLITIIIIFLLHKHHYFIIYHVKIIKTQ